MLAGEPRKIPSTQGEPRHDPRRIPRTPEGSQEAPQEIPRNPGGSQENSRSTQGGTHEDTKDPRRMSGGPLGPGGPQQPKKDLKEEPESSWDHLQRFLGNLLEDSW